MELDLFEDVILSAEELLCRGQRHRDVGHSRHDHGPVDAVIAENEGDVDAALEKALDEIAGAFDEKAERVALYIRERHALAKAIKEEEDRLAARKDALLKTAAEGLPDNGSVQYHLGMALKQLGQNDLAAATLQTAISLSATLTPDRLEGARSALEQLTRAESTAKPS